jgi:hypothetical protein
VALRDRPRGGCGCRCAGRLRVEGDRVRGNEARVIAAFVRRLEADGWSVVLAYVLTRVAPLPRASHAHPRGVGR